MAAPSENLSVSGLPVDITEEKVKQVLGQYGRVAQARILPPHPAVQGREAFVRMSTLEEAKWMVDNVNDNILEGMTSAVLVQYSRHKGPLSPWGGLPVSTVAPPASAPMMVPAAAAQAAHAGIGYAAAAAAVGFPAGAPPVTPGECPVGVMTRGVVKRWDAAKGFGFIGPDAGGPDVFVHVRELSDGEMLVQGSQVMFEAQPDPTRGPGKLRAKVCMGAVARTEAPPEARYVPHIPQVTPPPGAAAAEAPPPAGKRIFIQGLPTDMTVDAARKVFEPYGSIVSVQKATSPTGLGGAMLIEMEEVEHAQWLVDNVHENIPSGLKEPVHITFARGAGVPQFVPPPAHKVVAPPGSRPAAANGKGGGYWGGGGGNSWGGGDEWSNGWGPAKGGYSGYASRPY